MARLWSSGAEQNSTSLEGLTTSGANITIVTSPVRTGSYSYRANDSGTSSFIARQITASTTDTGTYFIRTYLYITTAPSADRYVVAVVTSGAGLSGGVKLTTTSKLQLFQYDGGAGTQVGSDSSALSSSQWYRIDLKIQGTNASTGELRARLDESEFAGSASASTNYVYNIRFGNAGGGTTTLDLKFDDLAINDTTGTAQTSWVTDGSSIINKNRHVKVGNNMSRSESAK